MPIEIVFAMLGGILLLVVLLLTALHVMGERALKGRREGPYTSNPGNSSSNW